MPWKNDPELFSFVTALLVIVASAVVSMFHRLAAGQQFTVLWGLSQFTGAMLAGYLALDMYPTVKASLPEWVTLQLFVSFVTYNGGRVFTVLEKLFEKRTGISLSDKP